MMFHIQTKLLKTCLVALCLSAASTFTLAANTKTQSTQTSAAKAPKTTPPLIVTYRSPASENDEREIYYISVLKLALDKTRKTYGDYEIQYAPIMTEPREFNAMNGNQYQNYILDDNYEDKFKNSNLDVIEIPVELGILGFRICFVSPNAKKIIRSSTSLEELKRFSIGQGIGWADAQILTYNGFKVVEIEQYDSAFKMVANNRIDLFCRGINELPLELKTHQHISGLTYDDTFALVYPLPRFFIHNKKNTELHQRITEGLRLAYADGSFKRLFLSHYQAAIKFAQLNKRKIYHLENPLIKTLSNNYESYFYDPAKK